ncbi:SH3 domain-containing protein [Pedobacter sp. MC2016-05]|uniref:SH3 domain-containing protein n=1 Tax=Pedobacter sp. MC2016-05 TaxID=2994474 RepID=UPI00224593ED|nr:SH3 domain-containing protein [Pedobacter sp. MC2016-05]MCX2477044.1 SH3 domain-containing protein [Pedobacter sp. MC2016-05]
MIRIFFLITALFLTSNFVQAQETYRVKADKLRVRASSDPKSKVVANLLQNESVTILDASDAKFYKIKIKSGEGWVSKDFIEKVPSTTPASTSPATTPQTTTVQNSSADSTADVIYRVTTDNLRVRQKADPKSKVIGYLPENENVAVIDSADASYFKIKVTNGEGWVSKEFLVRVSPVKAPIKKNTTSIEIPSIDKDYSNIIFFVLVALVMGTILYFIFKYSNQNKILIGISAIVVLVVIYFCFVTFIQPKKVSGTFISDSETQYKTFDFGTKDSVIVKDTYTDSTFTTKYVIEGDMIKLYDQQNMILLLIRDENTLIGEGFTRGTFTKK